MICPICKRGFPRQPGRERQTCGPACRRELIRRKRAEQDMANRRKHYVVKCTVCGRDIEFTGTQYHVNRRTTCSPACLRERKRQEMLARRPLDRPDVIERKIAGFRASPLCGPFETNASAKAWRLRSPDGATYIFRNLLKFLRDRPELFSDFERGGKPPRACCGLKRIRPDASEPRQQWHGWTWVDD